MKHGLFVIVESLHVLAGLNVPNSNCGVTRAANDYVLVVLKAEDAARVSAQGFGAFGLLFVPYFYRVVAQAAYYFIVIVL